MIRWTKIKRVALAGLVFGLIVAGDAASHHARAVDAVRIGTFSTAIDYAPLYIAKREGWLDEVARKHNVTIEYRRFDTLAAINDALAAKKLDMIAQADTPAIYQTASGNKLLEIAPFASLIQEIIVAPGSRAEGLADLKGKRIGVLFGSGFHYGAVKGIEKLGLPPDAMTLVNLPPAEARAAFAAKTIDAWLIWPPFVQQEVVGGTGKAIPGARARANISLFAPEDFVKQNAALVAAVSGVMKRAQEFARTDPRQAITLVAAETALPERVVAMAWSKIDFSLTAGPDVLQEMNGQAGFLFKEGFIAQEVKFAPSFFQGFGSK